MSRERIERALKRATDTKACVIGEDVLPRVVPLFREWFPGSARATVVCDPRTRAAAGERVAALLREAGIEVAEHVLEPGGATFHADYRYAAEVRDAIAAAGGPRPVPVAVGSGVVNDLVKRASGELGAPYLTVATAASVDGYSSFGAALRSPEGAKITYPCPAPRVVLADLGVLRTAPPPMTASGFADLLAKVVAGADWILAAELGAAEWHAEGWETVQGGLPDAVGNPEGVAAMEGGALGRLVEGLMLGGFAMQDMQSSRPASGAEHMFSHLLEMRDHTYRGEIVPHGIQVGVFTHFMCRVYERILAFDYGALDVDACLARWKPLEEQERIGAQVFAGTKFADLGVKSVRAKFVDRETQRARLEGLRARWPQIRERLAAQLLPAAEVERRLRVVGAPAEPEEIGSTREATLADARRTIYMRDRYMALDLLDATGQLDAFARDAFAGGGKPPRR